MELSPLHGEGLKLIEEVIPLLDASISSLNSTLWTKGVKLTSAAASSTGFPPLIATTGVPI